MRGRRKSYQHKQYTLPRHVLVRSSSSLHQFNGSLVGNLTKTKQKGIVTPQIPSFQQELHVPYLYTAEQSCSSSGQVICLALPLVPK